MAHRMHRRGAELAPPGTPEIGAEGERKARAKLDTKIVTVTADFLELLHPRKEPEKTDAKKRDGTR